MNESSLKHYYDALYAGRTILEFTRGKSFEDYCASPMLSAAVERKFEIIGEALSRIKRSQPDDLRSISDWPAIVGFRNILAHGYDHIENTVVWGIVETQLPKFVEELESLPGLQDQ